MESLIQQQRPVGNNKQQQQDNKKRNKSRPSKQAKQIDEDTTSNNNNNQQQSIITRTLNHVIQQHQQQQQQQDSSSQQNSNKQHHHVYQKSHITDFNDKSSKVQQNNNQVVKEQQNKQMMSPMQANIAPPANNPVQQIVQQSKSLERKQSLLTSGGSGPLAVNKTGVPQFVGSYQIGQCIGRGAYGRVYKANDIKTKQVVAVKMVAQNNFKDEQKQSITMEIDLLKKLDHPNIVKYIDTIQTDHHLCIILEYVECGSLENLLKKHGNFNESQVAIYVKQVLYGLLYLHSQGVIHRDIKGGNILTTEDGVVKLADFGVATKLNEADTKKNSFAGSPYWMAPEVIEMSGQVTSACDIWSLGCTVVELLTGRPPYFDLMSFPAMIKVVQESMPVPEGCSVELKDFLMKCFVKDPFKRPNARGLLSHSWLTLFTHQRVANMTNNKVKPIVDVANKAVRIGSLTIDSSKAVNGSQIPLKQAFSSNNASHNTKKIIQQLDEGEIPVDELVTNTDIGQLNMIQFQKSKPLDYSNNLKPQQKSQSNLLISKLSNKTQQMMKPSLELNKSKNNQTQMEKANQQSSSNYAPLQTQETGQATQFEMLSALKEQKQMQTEVYDEENFAQSTKSQVAFNFKKINNRKQQNSNSNSISKHSNNVYETQTKTQTKTSHASKKPSMVTPTTSMQQSNTNLNIQAAAQNLIQQLKSSASQQNGDNSELQISHDLNQSDSSSTNNKISDFQKLITRQQSQLKTSDSNDFKTNALLGNMSTTSGKKKLFYLTKKSANSNQSQSKRNMVAHSQQNSTFIPNEQNQNSQSVQKRQSNNHYQQTSNNQTSAQQVASVQNLLIKAMNQQNQQNQQKLAQQQNIAISQEDQKLNNTQQQDKMVFIDQNGQILMPMYASIHPQQYHQMNQAHSRFGSSISQINMPTQPPNDQQIFQNMENQDVYQHQMHQTDATNLMMNPMMRQQQMHIAKISSDTKLSQPQNAYAKLNSVVPSQKLHLSQNSMITGAMEGFSEMASSPKSKVSMHHQKSPTPAPQPSDLEELPLDTEHESSGEYQKMGKPQKYFMRVMRPHSTFEQIHQQQSNNRKGHQSVNCTSQPISRNSPQLMTNEQQQQQQNQFAQLSISTNKGQQNLIFDKNLKILVGAVQGFMETIWDENISEQELKTQETQLAEVLQLLTQVIKESGGSDLFKETLVKELGYVKLVNLLDLSETVYYPALQLINQICEKSPKNQEIMSLAGLLPFLQKFGEKSQPRELKIEVAYFIGQAYQCSREVLQMFFSNGVYKILIGFLELDFEVNRDLIMLAIDTFIVIYDDQNLILPTDEISIIFNKFGLVEKLAYIIPKLIKQSVTSTSIQEQQQAERFLEKTFDVLEQLANGPSEVRRQFCETFVLEKCLCESVSQSIVDPSSITFQVNKRFLKIIQSLMINPDEVLDRFEKQQVVCILVQMLQFLMSIIDHIQLSSIYDTLKLINNLCGMSPERCTQAIFNCGDHVDLLSCLYDLSIYIQESNKDISRSKQNKLIMCMLSIIQELISVSYQVRERLQESSIQNMLLQIMAYQIQNQKNANSTKEYEVNCKIMEIFVFWLQQEDGYEQLEQVLSQKQSLEIIFDQLQILQSPCKSKSILNIYNQLNRIMQQSILISMSLIQNKGLFSKLQKWICQLRNQIITRESVNISTGVSSGAINQITTNSSAQFQTAMHHSKSGSSTRSINNLLIKQNNYMQQSDMQQQTSSNPIFNEKIIHSQSNLGHLQQVQTIKELAEIFQLLVQVASMHLKDADFILFIEKYDLIDTFQRISKTSDQQKLVLLQQISQNVLSICKKRLIQQNIYHLNAINGDQKQDINSSQNRRQVVNTQIKATSTYELQQDLSLPQQRNNLTSSNKSIQSIGARPHAQSN